MTHSFTPRDWAGQPAYIAPDYRSTLLRGPAKPLIPLKQTLSEQTGPVFGAESVTGHDADLTRNGRRNGEPLGERIIVAGRVLDEDGRPIPNTLLEIWQANAAGRYIHHTDRHDAPIDPNFFGGTPLPRTVSARPPERVSTRSPSMCTSCPKRSRSRREISPMEMPVSVTSSLMFSAQAPERL